MPAETHIVSENPYGLDVLVNWIRYGTGKEPIQQILVFHDLRASFGHYSDLRVQETMCLFFLIYL